MLETHWKKASDIEAKIFNLRLDQAILGVNQIDKLVKDSGDQIKAAETVQKQIDALKHNPLALSDEEIEILQHQVILRDSYLLYLFMRIKGTKVFLLNFTLNYWIPL